MTKIYHANLYGLREEKYKLLSNKTIKETLFSEITPQSYFYLLIPLDCYLIQEYDQYHKINQIMPVTSTGIKTHRDHFVFDFDYDNLYHRIKDFRDLSISDLDIANKYNLKDTRDWKLSLRRQSLSSNQSWESHFTKCLYRPFDWREYYHHEDVVELPRNEVMCQFIKTNIALISSRQQSQQGNWQLVSITRKVAECCSASNKTKETNYVFPLYLYPDPNHTKELQQTKRPNFSPDFLKIIETKLGYLPTPEEIFYYIYGILHSPTYRIRYAEFLKIDFPRVPLTTDNNLFTQLSGYGEQLAQLHLMESPLLNNLITQFTQVGNREVIAGHPKYQKGNVYLNKTDYFTGVPENVWNFYVGGYQVCQKWLKDRKGRTLSDEDILHYQKIVVALQETIKLMELIDQAIPGFPIN